MKFPRSPRYQTIVDRRHTTVEEVLKLAYGHWPPRMLDAQGKGVNFDVLGELDVAFIGIGRKKDTLPSVLEPLLDEEGYYGDERLDDAALSAVSRLITHTKSDEEREMFEDAAALALAKPLPDFDKPFCFSADRRHMVNLRRSPGVALMPVDGRSEDVAFEETLHLLRYRDEALNMLLHPRREGMKEGEVFCNRVFGMGPQYAEVLRGNSPISNGQNASFFMQDFVGPQVSSANYTFLSIEVEARIQLLVAGGYSTWGQMPANAGQLLVALDSCGVEIPKSVLSEIWNTTTEGELETLRLFSRRPPEFVGQEEAIGVLDANFNAFNNRCWDGDFITRDGQEEWGEFICRRVLPESYGSLLQLYGDLYCDESGKNRMGFDAGPLHAKRMLAALIDEPDLEAAAWRQMAANVEPRYAGILAVIALENGHVDALDGLLNAHADSVLAYDFEGLVFSPPVSSLQEYAGQLGFAEAERLIEKAASAVPAQGKGEKGKAGFSGVDRSTMD